MRPAAYLFDNTVEDAKATLASAEKALREIRDRIDLSNSLLQESRDALARAEQLIASAIRDPRLERQVSYAPPMARLSVNPGGRADHD